MVHLPVHRTKVRTFGRVAESQTELLWPRVNEWKKARTPQPLPLNDGSAKGKRTRLEQKQGLVISDIVALPMLLLLVLLALTPGNRGDNQQLAPQLPIHPPPLPPKTPGRNPRAYLDQLLNGRGLIWITLVPLVPPKIVAVPIHGLRNLPRPRQVVRPKKPEQRLPDIAPLLVLVLPRAPPLVPVVLLAPVTLPPRAFGQGV